MAGTSCITVMNKFVKSDDKDSSEILNIMSEESLKHYKELTQHHDFIAFFRQATPIDAIETSKIGSRPSRRTGKKTISDLRAIPWVFSWNQSRFHITSWYGVGSTLLFLKTKHPEKFRRLQELVKSDKLVRYILTNIDTSLAGTDEDIINLYSSLVQDKNVKKNILDKIFAELTLTQNMMSELIMISMEERRKNHYYSTKLRAEALDNLHRDQVSLLAEWRAKKAAKNKEAEELQVKLLKSINAIANAMGNTG
jgi:phosphoenolpyruvate carboxylase